MCRPLQADLGEMGNRITTAFRHLLDLFEDQVVVIAGERAVQSEANQRHHHPHA